MTKGGGETAKKHRIAFLPNSEDDRFLVVSKESIMTPPGGVWAGSAGLPAICRRSAGALPSPPRPRKNVAKNVVLDTTGIKHSVFWRFLAILHSFFKEALCETHTCVQVLQNTVRQTGAEAKCVFE